MSKATPPKRRFAPIPIETTFDSNRKTGPTAELTPSPSPRSPSPLHHPREQREPRDKRRFAPQLVESSVRRSRRAGDEGPATKPTDKTDITPYTKHIYAPKAKKRHDHHHQQQHHHDGSPLNAGKAVARRESCDDEIASGVFDLVAKDAQRKLQEAALSAFPNSNNIRIGGAEHFYVREGSDSDSTPSRGRSMHRDGAEHGYRFSRRNSSEEDVNWAFKEMQEHAQVVEKMRQESAYTLPRISSAELDKMRIESPVNDVMKFTRGRQSTAGSARGSPLVIGESHMPFIRSESPLPTIGESTMPYIKPSTPPIRPIGETPMPYIPSAPPGKAGAMPFAAASQIPPETGFRNRGSPFGGFQNTGRDMSLDRLRNLHRMKNNSPPMLGKDLEFRTCPSPKQTKLEPDHLWDLETGTTAEESNRDRTGQHGLWMGYCYSADQTEALAALDRPVMLATPYFPGSPIDPFDQAFANNVSVLSEEPTPASGATRTGTMSGAFLPLTSDRRQKSQLPKGLHMLHGLEERLRKHKADAELEDRIAAEFDDTFVTQVYNYLSLGYPAMARAYDDELSKISRISMNDLEHDDDSIMDQLADGRNRVGTGAKGYILEEQPDVNEEERCPRWKALKKYIHEWARQHPDLGSISPLAWGVRERRGSWGI